MYEIVAYIYPIYDPNVGNYSSPMDGRKALGRSNETALFLSIHTVRASPHRFSGLLGPMVYG